MYTKNVYNGMGNVQDLLRGVVGFQWDSGNATKNWDKHDVSQSECEQVFFNLPFVVVPDTAHADSEQRYHALGRTDSGRCLLLVFTTRDDLIRVISARDMSVRERRRYGSEDEKAHSQV
ncbi:MAG: BrnT family toxin [Candidatus Fermentibacteraceae bacterium]